MDVTGNIDNPTFCKMTRHYVKCQKSLGNIHTTSLTFMYNARYGEDNTIKINNYYGRLYLSLIVNACSMGPLFHAININNSVVQSIFVEKVHRLLSFKNGFSCNRRLVNIECNIWRC